MNYTADSQALRMAWERDQTKAMVTDPKQWPLWPLLPLKNRHRRDKSNFPLLGYVHDESVTGKGYTVYLGNPWAPTPLDEIHKRYANEEELVDDGWIVD